MVAKKEFKASLETAGKFLQARTALEKNGDEVVLLDFEMLDVEPRGTTVSLACPLKAVRKLVHSCLAALDSFGDQPASVLLDVLKRAER